MIKINDFFELIDFKVIQGFDYGWNCFGPNAFMFCSHDDSKTGQTWESSIVFDTKTQEVYRIEICDYDNNRAYTWMPPTSCEKYDLKLKGYETETNTSGEVAWDDVKFTRLDLEEDFLTKARAIIKGEEYDTRVEVQINLSYDELFRLMDMAHRADKTLNEFVAELLEEFVKKND